MIGYATLRQVRVKNNSCSVSSGFKNLIDTCYSDSFFQMDSKDFSFNWSSFNSSFIPNIEMLNTYKSFQHMSASSLENYPYMTGLNTYLGDGYVLNLTGSLNEVQSNLTLLRKLNWIDRQTRAIFIQFLLFNPNINMFAYLNILFEILPSGNMINSIQIEQQGFLWVVFIYLDLSFVELILTVLIYLVPNFLYQKFQSIFKFDFMKS